jgi:hypothetical protein
MPQSHNVRQLQGGQALGGLSRGGRGKRCQGQAQLDTTSSRADVEGEGKHRKGRCVGEERVTLTGEKATGRWPSTLRCATTLLLASSPLRLLRASAALSRRDRIRRSVDQDSCRAVVEEKTSNRITLGFDLGPNEQLSHKGPNSKPGHFLLFGIRSGMG